MGDEVGKACKYGSGCTFGDCIFKHPPDRVEILPCHYAASCTRGKCPFRHAGRRRDAVAAYLLASCQPRPCQFGVNCHRRDCWFDHPPGRDLAKAARHPDQDIPCRYGANCKNTRCTFVHLAGGLGAREPPSASRLLAPASNPPHAASAVAVSSDVAGNSNGNMAAGFAAAGVPIHASIETTVEQQRGATPSIAKARDQFQDMLRESHVVVVAGETGCGKTSFLPLYCANALPSAFVVCTQPRPAAAVSLAHRVGNEVKSTFAAGSVGYDTGTSRVPGRRLMYVADSVVVRMAQEDADLPHIGVLVIDEAHERTLYTDIVMGLAKRILARRPRDFYVVIALTSSVDSRQFIDFLIGTSISALAQRHVLQLPTQTFSVTVEYVPPAIAGSDGDNTELDIERHLLPVLRSALVGHDQGNVLVFLPSPAEVHAALRSFHQPPPGVEAFPLHGGLSPEEQTKVMKYDDYGGTRRMVVFCTSIAETMLPVPNVRLVVDSGLSKDRVWDAQRGLEMEDVRRHSQVAADQRKSRAGCTGSGHCIRLWSADLQLRPTLEPEIVRQSLDAVALALCCANMNPRTFSYMDPPPQSVLDESMQLLQRFGCIECPPSGGPASTGPASSSKAISSTVQVTPTGRLFATLPLPPRLCAFIIEGCRRTGGMPPPQAVVGIAVLLSTSSGVFVRSGSLQQRQEAAAKRASAARDHSSDLLYEYSIFADWFQAGVVDGSGKCVTCQKAVARAGCQSCRERFSEKHLLYNRALKSIAAAIKFIQDILAQPEWALVLRRQPVVGGLPPPDFTRRGRVASPLEEGHLSALVGSLLLYAFPERCGLLLAPDHPDAGIRLIYSDVRGAIDRGSTVMQQVRAVGSSPLFMVMESTRLSNGLITANKLHPLPADSQLPRAVSVEDLPVLVHTEPCVGESLGRQLELELEKLRRRSDTANKWARFTVAIFDGQAAAVHVYAPACDSVGLRPFLESYFARARGVLHNQQLRVPLLGLTEVVVGPGLQIEGVQSLLTQHNRAGPFTHVIRHVPSNITTCQAARAWLCEELHLRLSSDMLQITMGDGPRDENHQCALVAGEPSDMDGLARHLVLQVSDEDNSKLVAAAVNCHHANIQKPDYKSSGCHTFIAEAPMTIPILSLSWWQTLNAELQLAKLESIVEPPLRVNISNLPYSFTREALQTLLDELGVAAKGFSWKQPLSGLPYAELDFDTYDSLESARQCLQERLCGSDQYEFQLKHRGTVRPRVTFNGSLRRVKVIMASEALAVRASTLASAQSVTIDAQRTVEVHDADLFDLRAIVNASQDRSIGVVIEDVTRVGSYAPVRGRRRVTLLIRSSNVAHANAVHAQLLTVFQPTRLKMSDSREEALFRELASPQDDQLERWGTEFGVRTKLQRRGDGTPKQLIISGPRAAHGQFLRKLADYTEDFDARHHLVSLHLATAELFKPGRVGATRLQDTLRQFPDFQVTPVFVPRPMLQVVWPPKKSQETCQRLMHAVSTLIVDLGGHAAGDFNASACVFCVEQTLLTLALCGHPYCTTCVINKIKADPELKICCAKCQAPVTPEDVALRLEPSMWESLVMDLIKTLLERSSPVVQQLAVCPSQHCQRVVPRVQGYQPCPLCSTSVCLECQICSSALHQGRSCAEVQALRQDDLFKLPSLAEEFARENWPVDMPAITAVWHNPAIAQHEAAPAVRRFLAGVGRTASGLVNKGFFAWHGTAKDAVASICHEGFDPGRRVRHAHGHGEYFGQSAAVSKGYVKGANLMLVAFLLRRTEVRTYENICYIVANPVDWSASYCLPVAVLAYSAGVAEPQWKTIASDSAWVAPYRWLWQSDDGSFQPYDESIVAFLERANDQYRHGAGMRIREIGLPAIRRHKDGRQQRYRINLQTMRQINCDTRYARAVQRERASFAAGSGGEALVIQHHSVMRQLESVTQAAIAARFREYVSGQGPSTATVHDFDGGPVHLDFVRGTARDTNLGHCWRLSLRC